jgi:hypothetical protein
VSTNQAIFGHDHTTLTTFSTIIHHDSDKFKVNNLTYQTKMKENSKNIKTARRKISLHSFLTTAPQQTDVADSILLFFYKKKRKQNKKSNKILPATSACYEAVVRNECRDHFSWD